MPFNGLGTFTQLYNWLNDAAAGILIRADRSNSQDADFATGLTNCITKDGQTVVTADLPMSGFKHLNCADAVNVNEYATLNQLMNLSSSAGTYAASTISSSGASQALDLVTYQSYFITLTAACAITITGNPTSGTNLNERLIVLLQNNIGGYAITWPASIKWTGTASPSTAPTLGTSANTYALIRLKTLNSGVTWIGSIEGAGGQGGGNLPVAGLYLAVGAALKANKSSDGINFTASTLSFAASTDILDVIYNTVYSRFIVIGKPTAGIGTGTPAQWIRYTTDGTTYSSATGSDDGIPVGTNATKLKLHQFSNGNIVTNQGGGGASGPLLSTNGGTSWSAVGSIITNGSCPVTGWVGIANSAYTVDTGSASFYYTTNGGVTVTRNVAQTGVTDTVNVAYMNGNYVAGGATGNLGYKTVVSATALTTITSNLASAAFLGGIWTGSTYIVWTAASLSTATTIGGTYTSRTTAFFTTSGMTGNIVAMAINQAQTVVIAANDTGDIARSVDGGITWSKLSVANNPLAGSQIYGISFVDSNFWVFGDSGKIAFSVDGVSFTSALTSGFSSSAILAFAGA